MSGLKFNKEKLGNLEYSLGCEMLSTDRSGGYMSSTIVCCNTRKYHGLMVTPVPEMDQEKNYVLLSSLDETVIQHDQSFNLGIHRFPGIYEPRGHKYITDFQYSPTPSILYRVGGVRLKKELLWVHDRTHLMIRYTLLEARSQTIIRLRPFLAFRDAHTVTKANTDADGRAYEIESGVRCRMYPGFPWLHMQVGNAEFVAVSDWYYNFEYPEEQRRGYPYREDLLTPGYFEFPMEAGESVIFSCSFEEEKLENVPCIFEAELKRRSERTDMISSLKHSAGQFLVRRGHRSEVIAGYPWFGSWGRDTFIALPGLTLTQGLTGKCMEIVDSMIDEMEGGLFPNVGEAYNSVDAPLWFFWTLQQLEKHAGKETVWERYGETMKKILNFFMSLKSGGIMVADNGLIWVDIPGQALTWMDAVVEGVPVTPRNGYQVEINALWYNAVCYTLELAESFRDKDFTERWKHLPGIIEASFGSTFWNEENGYLADRVNADEQDISIRPNQIIACALDYRIPDNDQIISVIETVKSHLLTPKGLRTLSPVDPSYQGRYEGDQSTRDRQYHQGTVWPWLLEHYVKANFLIYGDSFVPQAAAILYGFQEDITSYGVGSVPEIYDGDPPHVQRGAPWQAWSVGALLRIDEMIKNHSGRGDN